MRAISTPEAPAARGHYSQAIVHGGLVYVAGQLPLVPGEPDARLAGFETQARQVIDNVVAILEAAGSGADLVLKATVYIADVAHWPAFNALYAERFGGPPPARSTVQAARLPRDAKVEIEVIAIKRGR